MTQQLQRPSIDSYLGPTDGRFFGSGFKRVSQELTEVRLEGGRILTATSSVRYPADWSRKAAGTDLRPHLSSLDALVLSARMIDIFLTYTYDLSDEQRQRAWLRRYVMKAGTSPEEELAALRSSARLAGSRADPDSLCGNVSVFDCLVGRMKVRCEVEHAGTASQKTPNVSLVDLSGGGYYGVGYKRYERHIDEVTVGSSGQRATASVAVKPGPEPVTGFESAYQPSLTTVDSTLVLAQLAQVLLYQMDGIDRSQSNTLWMRRIDMSTRSPYQPLTEPFSATVSIIRNKLIEHAGKTWRVCDFAGDTQQIHADYSLAHELPATKRKQA